MLHGHGATVGCFEHQAFRTTFLPLARGSSESALRIEFYFGGNVVGSHDLATPPNDNALGCKQCIDADVDDTMFFQSQGTLDVTAIGDSTVTATFANVKLVELDGEFDPIPNGRCVAVANGSIDIRPLPTDRGRSGASKRPGSARSQRAARTLLCRVLMCTESSPRTEHSAGAGTELAPV